MRFFGCFFVFLFFVACTSRRQETFFREADRQIDRQDYEKAVELLRQVVALNPESEIALKSLYKLGFILESYLRDPEGALLCYEEFVRQSKDPARIYEIRKRIANIYFEQKENLEKAIGVYETLITENPKGPESDLFRFRIAKSHFHLNQFEKSRSEFQRLVEDYPESALLPKARYEIANNYFMQEKYALAIEALKQLLRHHSSSAYAVEAQFLMALCLEYQNQFQSALDIFLSLKGRYPSEEVLAAKVAGLKTKLK